MTHLVRTILSLGLVAGPVLTHGAGRGQRPLEELPKAPVMIVLPDAAPQEPVAKGRAAPRAPKSAPVQATAPAPKAPPAVIQGPPVVMMAPRVGMVAPVPPERRPGYGLVEQKCGRCHGVEKALNAGFDADEWDAYLRKKLRRAGAGITQEQAAEIGGFLRGLATHRDGG